MSNPIPQPLEEFAKAHNLKIRAHNFFTDKTALCFLDHSLTYNKVRANLRKGGFIPTQPMLFKFPTAVPITHWQHYSVYECKQGYLAVGEDTGYGVVLELQSR
jgi:hypothetical protein